jgi:hypothetical protein
MCAEGIRPQKKRGESHTQCFRFDVSTWLQPAPFDSNGGQGLSNWLWLNSLTVILRSGLDVL